LTTTNSGGGQADSCTVTLGVNTLPTALRIPDIVSFTASPVHFESGQSTTLRWAVDDADTVTISGLGTVPSYGSRVVSPTEPTSYLLTATNSRGTVTTRIFVNVFSVPLAAIQSFTADRPSVSAPGTPVRLTCNTTGAATVLIANAQFFNNSPTLEVYPPATTTYTCIATNPNGQTATQTVTVTVGAGAP
jgi:hypothetical protein